MTDFAARRVTMVDTQIRPSDVTKFPIIDAMLKVRREAFVPDAQTEAAYIGETMAIGQGRFMLDPRVFAKMLDAVNVQSTELVLDIGCGLGYSSAVLGRLAEAVVAIESSEDLCAEAETQLAEEGALNVAVIAGPLADGAAKHAPFDVIVLQGMIAEVPASLVDQLADGGRICGVFDDGGAGAVRLGFKSDGNISWRFVCNAGTPMLPGFEKSKSFAL